VRSVGGIVSNGMCWFIRNTWNLSECQIEFVCVSKYSCNNNLKIVIVILTVVSASYRIICIAVKANYYFSTDAYESRTLLHPMSHPCVRNIVIIIFYCITAL